MKLAVTLVALIWLMAVLGCQNKAPEAGMPLSPEVADVSTPAPPMRYEPAPAPVNQPVVYDSAPAPASAPAPVAENPSRGAERYTIQKGDTLYSLAKSRYGNGNDFPKILAANPGLTPETLKVGQTITIPQ